MRIESPQDLTAGPGDASFICTVRLPALAHKSGAALAGKVGAYLKAFFETRDTMSAVCAPLSALEWRIVCPEGLKAGLQWMRADLAHELFGHDEGAEAGKGAVTLTAETAAETPAEAAAGGTAAQTEAASVSAAKTAAPSAEDAIPTLSLDLAGFRDDVKTIAESLRTGPSITVEIARFREEMDDMAEHLRHSMDAAADKVSDAAGKVEAAARAMPDIDRFELVMARNEDSAAMLEHGVGRALGMLMEACEKIAGPDGKARALPAPADDPERWDTVSGDRYVDQGPVAWAAAE